MKMVPEIWSQPGNRDGVGMKCQAVAIGFGFCFGAVRGPRVKWGEDVAQRGGRGGLLHKP